MTERNNQTNRMQHDPVAWSIARQGIGRCLREIYQASEEMSSRLAALLPELEERLAAPGQDDSPHASRT